MNLQKIKEAIAFERQHNCEYANVLCDLAEKVLAVAGKIPKKKKLTGLMTSAEANRSGYNDAIDQCTIAFAGMIPEEKKFGAEFDERSNCDSNYVNGWNSCREYILSAMKGGQS